MVQTSVCVLCPIKHRHFADTAVHFRSINQKIYKWTDAPSHSNAVYSIVWRPACVFVGVCVMKRSLRDQEAFNCTYVMVPFCKRNNVISLGSTVSTICLQNTPVNSLKMPLSFSSLVPDKWSARRSYPEKTILLRYFWEMHIHLSGYTTSFVPKNVVVSEGVLR